jgi:LysR family hydrogen peroxide-inducible transcriptional activator
MLYEYQTDVMLEKLHSGEIDVGILALPVSMDGLESYELYREPFTVALPANHRLANRASIKVSDSQRRNAAAARRRALPARPGARHLFGLRTSREAGFPRHQPRDAAARWWLQAWASRCCPSSPAAARMARRAGVSIKPFAKPVPTRTIGAIWRKSSARREAIPRALEAHRGERAVIPQPLDLRASDGRKLAAHLVAASRHVAAQS